MKRLISIFLSIVMLTTSVTTANIVSLADEAKKEVSISDAQSLDDVSEQDAVLAYDNKTAKSGYSMVNNTAGFMKTPSLRTTIYENGSCGANITFTFDSDGILKITGTGAMKEFSNVSAVPWSNYATSIVKVEISSGITSISPFAFYNCKYMREISIPSTVTSIGKIAFGECKNLTSITLPSGVKEIPYAAFANCAALESFTAPSITTINNYAFQGAGLKTFTFGKNLKTVSSLAFFDSSIESFKVDSANTVFTAKNGVIFGDKGKTLLFYPGASTAVSYKVDNTVTKIGDMAFANAKYLQSVTIPDSVTYIGESAFQATEALKTITIPDSVTSVGMFTFYNSAALESVTFGKGLKATSYEMFENCKKLKNIYFSSAIQELDARTFAYCSSLVSVILPANIKTIGNGVFGECSALQSLTISGVKVIPYQAFLNCTALASITLAEGLQSIERCAFYGCRSLTKVTAPKTVTYISNIAFNKNVSINNLNTKLKKFGYNGYRYLQNISITGTAKYSYAYKVLDLVNAQRKAAGVQELSMDKDLLDCAMKRADEIAVLYSHTRPDGSTIFEMNDKIYGENIAVGYSSAADVMSGWMSSIGHKANILDEDYTTIGIGCFVINGICYWVQNFGINTTVSAVTKPADKTVTDTINIATGEFSEGTISTDIIWGETETYHYTLGISLADKIKYKKSSKAYLTIANTGYPVAVKINNTGTWSSSKTNVASVNGGTVTGVDNGSATITAKLDYYSAKKNVTVEGNKKTVTLSASSYVYNGKAKKPSVTVKDVNGSTISKDYYTVSYSNNKNVGKATVKITFKTKFNGSVSKTFKIVPKSTSLSKLTAKKKGFTVKWNKQKTQTTGYQIQYSTDKNFKKNNKTVTVSKNSTTSKTISKLKAKKKYYVRIRTYKTVSGTKYYSSWSKAKSITTKK